MGAREVVLIPRRLAQSAQVLHEIGAPAPDYTVTDAVKDTVMSYDHTIWPFGEITGEDFAHLMRNIYAPSFRLDFAVAACAWVGKIKRDGGGVKCSPVVEPWKMDLLKIADYGKTWRAE